MRRRKVLRDQSCVIDRMKAMNSDLDIHEQRVLGSGLLVLALSFAGWSAASVWFAMDHMARLGAICGDVAPHCGWCVSAAGAAIAAMGAAWAGLRLLAGMNPALAARRPG